MSEIDEILGHDSEPVTMTESEWIEKSRKFIEKLYKEYFSAHEYYRLKNEDYPDKSICDKCTGCGFFVLENETIPCMQTPEGCFASNPVLHKELFVSVFEGMIPELIELSEVEKLTKEEKK